VTEQEVAIYLEDNGFPPHIVEAGSRGLVERWQEFVGEVERGYPYGLTEYRHDLDLRGAIAQLQLDEQVVDADGRFEALLEHREVRVWESGGQDPWWDFGYPRNARGYLLRRLKEAGLIVEDE
jgi:hypothetical protein